MALFNVKYSVLIQEFYTLDIEANSEKEARELFETIPKLDLVTENFDDLEVLNSHIEFVDKVITE